MNQHPLPLISRSIGPLCALATLVLALSGCSVVGAAASVAGTAVSVAGTVVSTGVSVTGKVVEKAIDASTSNSTP